MSRLENEKIQKEYSDRLRSCLGASSCMGLTGDVKDRWTSINDGFCKAAEATLKYQGVNKKEERVKVRAKLLNSKYVRIHERILKYYDANDKEVKKSARRDHRAFTNLATAKEAEEAANNVIWVHFTR